MVDVVKEIEKRFLPSLKRMHQELSRRFPDVNIRLTSFDLGELGGNLGHAFNIECLLPRTIDTQTDNVALDLILEHLDSNPTVYSSVTWGHPSGYTEEEAFQGPKRVSDDTLLELEAKLPVLFDRLNDALENGRPRNEF
jgi:hypothetical protein